MNEPTTRPTAPLVVHQPTPVTPAAMHAAPIVPVQPGHIPAVASVVLPDGRVVTGYTVAPAQPEPVAAKPAVSRTAVNEIGRAHV